MTEPRRSMDEYGPQDMAIPEWRLLQKTGGDWAKELGGKPGQFFNKITDEIADELNIVVVDILTGRAKWGTEISDAGPACASVDAKSNLSIYGDDCSKCPDRLDAPWSVEATERRKKCCINYTILGIDLDHDHLPSIIRAHGTSALAIRQLITQLKLNRSLRGEYYRATVNIKHQEKTTPYGQTYVLHPIITGLITDESKVAELKGESNRLLGAPIPLPEGRPDDEAEPEPLGFTPDGTPFYSEEERLRLMEPAAPSVEEKPAEAAPDGEKVAAPPAEKKAAAPAKGKQEKLEPEKPPEPEPPREEAEEPIDLEF